MEDWSDDRLLTETPTTPAAFGVFYRRHENAVLGYFMRRTGDAELAADLAAETFAAALLGARRFKPERGEAVGWLYGIARHRLMRSIEQGRVEDRARRRLTLPRLEIDDDLIERIEALGRGGAGARAAGQAALRPGARPCARGCSTSAPTRTSPPR